MTQSIRKAAASRKIDSFEPPGRRGSRLGLWFFVVWGLGFWGFGFRVLGLGFWGFGFWVLGLGFWGFGFRV